VYPANSFSPIGVIESGITIGSNDEHPLNADALIVPTCVGREIADNLEHPLNADTPISVIE
jgi:hypothetical protein